MLLLCFALFPSCFLIIVLLLLSLNWQNINYMLSFQYVADGKHQTHRAFLHRNCAAIHGSVCMYHVRTQTLHLECGDRMCLYFCIVNPLWCESYLKCMIVSVVVYADKESDTPTMPSLVEYMFTYWSILSFFLKVLRRTYWRNNVAELYMQGLTLRLLESIAKHKVLSLLATSYVRVQCAKVIFMR